MDHFHRKSVILAVWAVSLNFLHDFTLFVIDTFSDTIHIHGSAGLVPKIILTPCHVQSESILLPLIRTCICVCVFVYLWIYICVCVFYLCCIVSNLGTTKRKQRSAKQGGRWIETSGFTVSTIFATHLEEKTIVVGHSICNFVQITENVTMWMLSFPFLLLKKMSQRWWIGRNVELIGDLLFFVFPLPAILGHQGLGILSCSFSTAVLSCCPISPHSQAIHS